MSIELKVKVKSLAEEARIIRREERKAKVSAKWHREHQEGVLGHNLTST